MCAVDPAQAVRPAAVTEIDRRRPIEVQLSWCYRATWIARDAKSGISVTAIGGWELRTQPKGEHDMAFRRRLRAGLETGLVCGLLALGLSIATARADERPDAGATRVMTATLLEERIAAGDLEYRDAGTGEIVVATAERVAAIRESLAPQFAPVSGVHQYARADGTVQVTAEQTFSDVMLSRVNLDGTRSRACFRDLDAAVAFVVGLDAEQNVQTADPTRIAVAE